MKLQTRLFMIGLLLLAFGTGRLYLIPDSYLLSKVFHSIGLHINWFVLAVFIACYIPYRKLGLKIFFVCYAFYEFCAMVFYSFVQIKQHTIFSDYTLISRWVGHKSSAVSRLGPEWTFIQDAFVPALLLLIALYFPYLVFKRLDYSYSDKNPNFDNVIALYSYPTSCIGILLTFCRWPIDSFSLYCDGYQYTFKRGHKYMQCIPMTKKQVLSGEFFVKTTPYHKSTKKSKLDKMVGNVKWTIFHNCLNVFNPVIGRIDAHIKWRILN